MDQGLVPMSVFYLLKVLNSVMRYFHPVAGSISKLHVKCRNGLYPRSSIQRFTVPDDRVSWDTAFPEYSPVHYTADVVASRPAWADPDFEYVSQFLCAIMYHSSWHKCQTDRLIRVIEYVVSQMYLLFVSAVMITAGL